MKIRIGFISNSSSSSFIIGWGLIRRGQEETLRKILNDNRIEFEVFNYDGHGHKYGDVKLYGRCIGGEERILTGGNHIEIIIPKEIAEYSWNDDGFLTVEITNNEGDGAFYIEGCDVLDYEKAKKKSYYSEEQQKIIELFDNKEIFKSTEVLIGAERNG